MKGVSNFTTIPTDRLFGITGCADVDYYAEMPNHEQTNLC